MKLLCIKPEHWSIKSSPVLSALSNLSKISDREKDFPSNCYPRILFKVKIQSVNLKHVFSFGLLSKQNPIFNFTFSLGRQLPSHTQMNVLPC